MDFVDLMISVRLFDDNDEFFNGQVKEQDPLWNTQAHLVYRFNRGRWLSLNANWFWGGQSTVDGQRINKGLVWRVYQSGDVAGAAPKLLKTLRTTETTTETGSD